MSVDLQYFGISYFTLVFINKAIYKMNQRIPLAPLAERDKPIRLSMPGQVGAKNISGWSAESAAAAAVTTLGWSDFLLSPFHGNSR